MARLPLPQMISLPPPREGRGCEYPVYIGSGVRDELGALVAERQAESGLVVADAALSAHATELQAQLRRVLKRVEVVLLPAGERTKDFRRLFAIYQALARLEADRRSLLFALGGGVIGDVTGFVAATFMRGIRWIGIPTTLLAQADSAIGGKTGVNHPSGKNLIGAIHQPELVLCDLDFLRTLERRDRVSGLAEIIKCGLALDPELLVFLEQHWPSILNLEEKPTTYAIGRAVHCKGRLVREDEFERLGRRELLNFGHTFGHALEALTGFVRYRHGEALIHGMRFALHLSQRVEMLQSGDAARAERLLARLDVPPLPCRLDCDRLIEFLRHDKKARNGVIHFVLLDGLGAARKSRPIPESQIREAMASFLASLPPAGRPPIAQRTSAKKGICHGHG